MRAAELDLTWLYFKFGAHVMAGGQRREVLSGGLDRAAAWHAHGVLMGDVLGELLIFKQAFLQKCFSRGLMTWNWKSFLVWFGGIN